MDAAPTTRRSAEDRRREIVEIAISHFAQKGYNGTSTDQVAREAGISQPYLFRLFGTKRELFLACHEVMHGRIAATFADAAREVPPADRMAAMGSAYTDLLADRTSLLFQMQSYGACSDPAIQARVRERYADLVRQVAEATGAGPAELWTFFAHGMLLNVIAALDLDVLAPGEEWAACWVDPQTMLEDAGAARLEG
jgi:AcrR family transcriptional regulator